MNESTIDEIAYESRFRNWPPLGKLLITLSFLISSLVSSSLLVPFIVFTIGIVLTLFSTRFRFPKILALGIAESLVIIAISCTVIVLVTGGVTIWQFEMGFISISIGREGLYLGLLIFLKALAGVTIMLFLASSTPVPHLAYAMRQLRMPKELTELVVLVYRYSFLMLEQLEIMYDAAKCRLGFKGLRNKMRTSGRLAVSLFIRSLGIADRAQMAMACRNFSGEFPVYRKPSRLTPVWGLAPLIIFAVLYSMNLMIDIQF
jgi:cobalt/nickel transport system permease protein